MFTRTWWTAAGRQSEDENGLALLRAAHEALVNEDDEIGYVLYADDDCECGQPECRRVARR